MSTHFQYSEYKAAALELWNPDKVFFLIHYRNLSQNNPFIPVYLSQFKKPTTLSLNICLSQFKKPTGCPLTSQFLPSKGSATPKTLPSETHSYPQQNTLYPPHSVFPAPPCSEDTTSLHCLVFFSQTTLPHSHHDSFSLRAMLITFSPMLKIKISDPATVLPSTSLTCLPWPCPHPTLAFCLHSHTPCSNQWRHSLTSKLSSPLQPSSSQLTYSGIPTPVPINSSTHQHHTQWIYYLFAT